MGEPLVLPRVKVCGLTRPEDVATALAAGADALGFVFHAPSPRSIEPDRAAELVAETPGGVLSVAVVVELEPDGARELLERTSLSCLQLCGSQRPEDWQRFPYPLLRRLAVEPSGLAELESWRSIAAGFVLDHPASAGGSGERVDLDLAAELAARAPCLLAGGLDGDNVEAAVRRVRPRGVDASSRLEAGPGRKDPQRVRLFVHRALSALQEPTP